MKKFSLLLCCFVALLASQRVYADGITESNLDTGISITISTSSAEQVNTLLTTYLSGKTNEQKTAWKASVKKIVLVGYYKTTDLQEIGSGAGFTSVTTVDMSEAKFVNSTSGASNDYQLFHESISGVAPKSGDKAIENARLYQYLHNKEWVDVPAPSEVVTAQYSNSTDRDAAIPTTALNAYSKTPTGNYKYCQMTVADESWSRMSITGLSSAFQVNDWYENSLEGHKQNYSNGQTVKLKRYYKKETASIGWVLRYPSATDLTASGVTVHNGNSSSEGGENADMTNLISDTGNPGDYIWFWVYYTKTNGSWGSMSMTDPGGAQEKSWLENTMNDHLSEVTDGSSVKLKRYYRKEAVSYAWNYVSDPSTVSGGTTYDGAAVGADMTNLFRSYASVGDYIWFWVYYTKNDTRSWTPAEGQDIVPDGFVENGNNVATFDFKDRNIEENKVGYTNEQWVKMPTYTYYQLQQNSNTALSWQVVPFTDGEIKTISYKVASGDLPSPATENQYGVVGGTPKVYNGSAWVDEADAGTVYTYDYSQMKFSQWQNTLTTAITSKYADSNTDNSIFDGCKLLTYVDFKAGTVRGLKDRKGSDYASGLKVIIGKNVSEIDASAFIRCEALTDLVFDKDYTGSAPQNDKLSGVTYPINLTIGDEAFEACSNLKEVEFPNRVTSIGNSAFKEVGTNVSEFKVSFERRYNKDDSNVSIDYDVDLTIGTQAFQGCSTLKKLELPIRLVSMGNDAFKLTTHLEEVTIREDVEDSRLTTIPSGAFEESGIVSIKIPKSITEIQSKAFGSCYALKEVEFQESNQRPQQPPLIIRTGAFATGDENSYHLEKVKVDYPPSTRLTVCEFNAFNFTSLVGQTNVSSKQIATLEFPSGDESWNFYAGEWKKGLAFSQSTLNAFKDGYNGMRSVDAQPTVASRGLVAGLEPANGWQQFTATNTGREVKIPEGNYIRTYSTATPHYIPIIAGTSSYLYDIFRISEFSDGYKNGDDIYSSAKADEAERIATATKVTDVISERKYVPAHTGLIMKIHGNSNDSYIVYQEEVPSDSRNFARGYIEYHYPENSSYDVNLHDVNLLSPSCDDTKVPVTENEKTVYKVVINPTDPYPIGELTGDKYRIFGLWVDDNAFWRSEPGVLINTDMAYLKLKIDQFHWANEDSGTSPTYPSSGSRIALVFANEESETSAVSSPVITKESSDCYYTIQGVKLSHPLGRGMYIHNGKKIFVK